MKKLICILTLLMQATMISAATSDTLTYQQQQRVNLIRQTHVVFTSDTSQRPSQDSVRSLIEQFYVDQFRHFQDPNAPYFMMMSKDADLAFGIGGIIRMRGWFDWNGTVNMPAFKPYAINIPKDPSSKRKLNGTPAGTALFFTILGRQTSLGQFMGYFEGNFDGYKHVGFKLKKAYVTFNDWTIGYARTTFSDPGAEAPVIDGAGPSGKVSHTTILVRWLHKFKKHWSVAASLELPEYGVQEQPGQTKKNTAYIPDIAAFLQYSYKSSHIRLAALYKIMSYRDLITASNHNKSGWGVQLSGTYQVGQRLSIYAAYSIGQGIGTYSNDLSSDNYDLVSDPAHPGTLYAPLSWGLSLGAQYYFTKNIFAAMTISESRYMPRHDAMPAEYKYGLYGAVNVFWDITPRLQVGAEYLIGKRMNFNHQNACADRIDALFQFSF